MKNKMINTVMSVAALGLAAGFANAAAAGPVDETLVQGQAVPVKHVSYERGELASQAGRESVERRIERAAESVCGSQDFRELGSLSRVRRNSECYENAIADAMKQLNSEQVATLD